MGCVIDRKELDEVVLNQVKREIAKHSNDVTVKLLKQEKKITELCLYFKDKLSNTIGSVIDDMLRSGELNEIISSVLLDDSFVRYSETEVENISETQLEAMKDISVEVRREFDTTYIVTRINNLRACLHMATGTNVVEYMKNKNKIVGINFGLYGVTAENENILININEQHYEGWYILGLSYNGRFKVFPRGITASAIINEGYISCSNIWCPLIQKRTRFDFNTLDKLDSNYDYIVTSSHPRQAVGVLEDGSYIVVTSDGRMKGEKGFTLAELQDIMMNLGCVEAYNLDGGASTQLVIGEKLMNRKLSESRTIHSVMTFEK